jgi:hypothetical protein
MKRPLKDRVCLVARGTNHMIVELKLSAASSFQGKGD